MNHKAFTRKEPSIPADRNRTLTQIEPSMPKQSPPPPVFSCSSLFKSAFDFYPREWNFPSEWRLWNSFPKHLAFDLFTHVTFMFLSSPLAHPPTYPCSQPISDHYPTTDDHYPTTDDHYFKVIWSNQGPLYRSYKYRYIYKYSCSYISMYKYICIYMRRVG